MFKCYIPCSTLRCRRFWHATHDCHVMRGRPSCLLQSGLGCFVSLRTSLRGSNPIKLEYDPHRPDLHPVSEAVTNITAVFDGIFFQKIFWCQNYCVGNILMPCKVVKLCLLHIIICAVQLTDVYDKQSLMFGTEADVLWYRPSSLKQLLSLKAHYRHAQLVSGATTVGVSSLC